MLDDDYDSSEWHSRLQFRIVTGEFKEKMQDIQRGTSTQFVSSTNEQYTPVRPEASLAYTGV